MCGFSKEMSLQHSVKMLLSNMRRVLIKGVMFGMIRRTDARHIPTPSQMAVNIAQLITHGHQGAALAPLHDRNE